MGGFCLPTAHCGLHGCSGRRQQSPSPGLAGVAAGVSPVASRRSCQSGQGETPPHANVASQRAYATPDRASATWTVFHQHRASPGGCTRLPSALPQPTKAPRLGSPADTHRPSGTDSPLCITAGYFPHQEKLLVVPQAWGRVVESSPEQLALSLCRC